MVSFSFPFSSSMPYLNQQQRQNFHLSPPSATSDMLSVNTHSADDRTEQSGLWTADNFHKLIRGICYIYHYNGEIINKTNKWKKFSIFNVSRFQRKMKDFYLFPLGNVIRWSKKYYSLAKFVRFQYFEDFLQLSIVSYSQATESIIENCFLIRVARYERVEWRMYTTMT